MRMPFIKFKKMVLRKGEEGLKGMTVISISQKKMLTFMFPTAFLKSLEITAM